MVDALMLEEVVRLTKHGVSAPEIAKRFSVSERTVTRYRVRGGVAKPKVTHSPEAWATARRLIGEGMNFTQVASIVGISSAHLARRFPHVPRLTHQEYGHLAELYRQAGL